MHDEVFIREVGNIIENDDLGRLVEKQFTPNTLVNVVKTNLHNDYLPLLFYALQKQAYRCLFWLLYVLKADPNRREPDFGGMTALHHVVTTYPSWRQDALLGVKILLASGADVNAVDDEGKTPLHYAIEMHRDEALIKCLLEHGADPNVPDANGQTPRDLYITKNPAVAGLLGISGIAGI